jgi:glycosyltransferase involved in cell wall biosynthesis
LKIAFITNLPSHYHIKVFETIAENYRTDFFFFSDASEKWIEKKNELRFGNFNGEYIRGFKISSRFRFNFPLIKKLLFNNYDVIIQSINGRFELISSFIISKIKKKPFILWTNLWFHPNTIFHSLTFPAVKFIYRRADALVVYGYHVKNYLLNLGVQESKIFFSWNVIDNSFYNIKVTEEEIEHLKDQYNLSYKFIILFVGRYSEEKGLVYLLDAVKLLPENLNTGVILIGGGKEKEKLIKYAHSLRLKNILFLNYLPPEELLRFYALADILVLPSISTKTIKETWGIVINEAMNQGCPVIASDAVGAAAGGLIQNGKNGIIFPEKDIKALSESITCLLKDPEKLDEMKKFTYEEIQKWDHNKSFKGFDDAIKFVLEKVADERR